VTIHAEGCAGPDEGAWKIIVADNGIGFDPKHTERIFQIFQRLHGRGEYEGSGIGLSICRKIVERHGGSIIAESELGAGAKFTITLDKRLLVEDTV
jgi:signal transduction histidine kinase